MVRRILGFVEREIRGLHQAAYVLGAFALFSQALALIRDRLLAGQFGAGETLDVYYAAFRIPDLIFVAVASFVSLYVIIPLLSGRRLGDPGSARFLSAALFLFTAAIGVVALGAFLLAPVILPWLFPGLAPSPLFDDLVALTRLLLLQPILLGISNLFGSVTQLHRKFLLYALSPFLYNGGIIIGITLLYPPFGLMGLGSGVVLGALLHMGVQLPFILRSRMLSLYLLPIPWEDIKRVLALSLPRTIGLSLGQVTLLILASLASLMASGSIAVFNLSFNLQSVPLAIIGVSYSVAAFPMLSRLFAGGDTGGFSAQVIAALRHIAFWSLPAVALFVVLRAQIVRVIFGVGEFDWTDTRLTAAALALFMVSLLAQAVTLLLSRGYYAAGNTRRPLLINVISSILTIALAPSLVLVFSGIPVFRFFIESLLRVGGLPGTEILMLPLAFSIGSLLNAGLLWGMFSRDFKFAGSALARPLFQSSAAGILAGFAAYHVLQLLDDVVDIDTFAGIFIQGLSAGLFGVIAGVLLLIVLRNREIEEIKHALMSRFKKATPIAAEPEEL